MREMLPGLCALALLIAMIALFCVGEWLTRRRYKQQCHEWKVIQAMLKRKAMEDARECMEHPERFAHP